MNAVLDERKTGTYQTESLDAAELEKMRSDDIHAARLIVCIMLGVFTAGLLIYSFICWQVM